MGPHCGMDWWVRVIQVGSGVGTCLLYPPTCRKLSTGQSFRPSSTWLNRTNINRCLWLVMDSAYMYDGLQGKALQWKVAGWVTTHGPVINTDLWDVILQARLLASLSGLQCPAISTLMVPKKRASLLRGAQTCIGLHSCLWDVQLLPPSHPHPPQALGRGQHGTQGLIKHRWCQRTLSPLFYLR